MMNRKRKRRPNGKYDTTENDVVNVRAPGREVTDSSRIELVDGETPLRENRRYALAAMYVGIVKYTALALFFLFFMSMTVAFSDSITVENFRYLLKDMNIDLPTSADEYGDILYVTDAERSFGLFRGDLVSLSATRLEVTDMAGRKIQSAALTMIKPRMATSGKYFIVYDLTNTEFAVYNSFSLLYTEKMDYPVTDASVNSDGYFLISTRTADYISTVYIYSPDMEQIFLWQSNDKYVFDTMLLDDGTFHIFASGTSAGSYTSEVITGNCQSEETKTVYTVDEAVPLSAYALDDGFVMLCSDRLTFFIEDKASSTYSFTGRYCKKCDFSSSAAAMVLTAEKAGGDNELVIFDSEGVILSETAVGADMTGLRVLGDGVYLIYGDRIELINSKTGKKYVYNDTLDVCDMVSPEDGVVLIITPGRAYPLSVADGFIPED